PSNARRRVAARRFGQGRRRRAEGSADRLSMASDGRSQSPQALPVGAQVPIVFIDCSPIMRSALDHLGLDHLGLGHLGLGPWGIAHSRLGQWGRGRAMVVHEGQPPPTELAPLIADPRVVLNGHTIRDEKVLSRALHLRSIVFLGTGASTYIDMSSAARRD